MLGTAMLRRCDRMGQIDGSLDESPRTNGTAARRIRSLTRSLSPRRSPGSPPTLSPDNARARARKTSSDRNPSPRRPRLSAAG